MRWLTAISGQHLARPRVRYEKLVGRKRVLRGSERLLHLRRPGDLDQTTPAPGAGRDRSSHGPLRATVALARDRLRLELTRRGWAAVDLATGA